MKKTEEIIRILTERIEARELLPDTRIPSSYLLAEELKVHRSTVNVALNILISKGILKKGSSARDGIYVNKCLHFSEHIAILYSARTSYFYKMLDGIYDEAGNKNYLLSTFSIRNLETIEEIIQKISAIGIKKVIIINLPYHELNYPDLEFFYIGNAFTKHYAYSPYISSDMYHAGYQLADTLINSGYNEILFVYQQNLNIYNSRRYCGIFDRMKKENIVNLAQHFVPVSVQSLTHNCHNILKKFPKTSCIIGYSDYIAYSVAKVMNQEFGSEIAKKIMYAGFGNLTEIQEVYPMLTVEQSPYCIGRNIIKLINCDFSKIDENNNDFYDVNFSILNQNLLKKQE